LVAGSTLFAKSAIALIAAFNSGPRNVIVDTPLTNFFTNRAG